MRQWSCKITAGDEGKSLGEILKAAGFSKKEISRQKFIADGITLDGMKCRVSERVRTGQTIALNFRHEECFETNKEAGVWDFQQSLLYEDDCLLIVEKPSGLSCHPGRGHYYDNLGSFIQAWYQEKGEAFPIREIGRLDKDTSGIVVFAKDQITAARLWKQRSRGELEKTYYAAVHGRLQEQEGLIEKCMCRVRGEKNKMQVCMDEMEAVTRYRVLKEAVFEGGRISIVECTLKTGRTHQIRVHMASMGNPVLGDCLYGVPDKAPRLCLHAGKICFIHPFTGEQLVFETKENFGNSSAMADKTGESCLHE